MQSFPEVRKLLARNAVTVTTISIVAGILTKKNKTTLLRNIEGKSQREVADIAARYRPERGLRDRVRPVAVVRPVSLEEEHDHVLTQTAEKDTARQMTGRAATEEQGSNATLRPSSLGSMPNDDSSTASMNNVPANYDPRYASEKCKDSYRRSGGKNLTTSGGSSAGRTGYIIEQKYELKFAVSPAVMKKIDEVKVLLSNRYPCGVNLASLMDTLLDEFIDRHSPEKRYERRDKRKQRAAARLNHELETDDAANKPVKRAQPAKPAAGPVAGSPKQDPADRNASSNGHSRYISPAVRDQVFTRDGGRCTFVGANGKRCGSSWDLQVDHINPYARGGPHTPGNLRLLCGKHNRLEAERIYGKPLMAQYYRGDRPGAGRQRG